MSIFSGMKEWVYGPQGKKVGKDDDLERDFGLSEDDTDPSPSTKVTYDVCMTFKRGDKTSVFPANQFLRDLRNLIDFADGTKLVQGMIDRKEIVLTTYEVVDDKPDKPATDTVIAEAMLASFMKANGLTAPQDPIDCSQLQTDLADAKTKISEQEQQITDLTTERDETQAKLASANTDLMKAQADLTAASSALDEAQKRIDAQGTTQQQLDRVLKYLQKQHGEEIDPAKLDDKGNIVPDAAPDPKATLQQLITDLQKDPANAAAAQLLQAVAAMIPSQPAP